MKFEAYTSDTTMSKFLNIQSVEANILGEILPKDIAKMVETYIYHDNYYPMAVELVNEIRGNVIAFTQNDKGQDQWDEYEGGVYWIYNELCSSSLNEDELSYVVYASDANDVNDCILRLAECPWFERIREVYNSRP